MSKPQDKLLDEKIDTALHPERNGLLLGKVAEGASHEHIIKKSIKDLITTECNKAEIRGIDLAFDSHDYDRIRARKQELEAKLNKEAK